jgi:hypothetical protein
VQLDGTLTRRPEGAVAIWLAPPGKTELTPGTGTLIGVPGITGFGTRALDSTGRMMDFDGIGQTVPDVTTRGMAKFACNGSVTERYYVDVYPALSAPAKLPPATKGTIDSGCGGGGGGGGGPGCVDHKAPLTQLDRGSVKLTTDHVFLKGTASDVGCAKLAAVLVSIARFDGHRCRFMQANGRLGKTQRCRNPVLLRASGKKAWSLKTNSHLTQGTYRLAVRSVDRAGNREQPSGHNNMRIEIGNDPPD